MLFTLLISNNKMVTAFNSFVHWSHFLLASTDFYVSVMNYLVITSVTYVLLWLEIKT